MYAGEQTLITERIDGADRHTRLHRRIPHDQKIITLPSEICAHRHVDSNGTFHDCTDLVFERRSLLQVHQHTSMGSD